MVRVPFFLSGDRTMIESDVDPSGITQCEESSSVLKLAWPPCMPTMGFKVPSCGPLHEVFHVLPSASTLTSVHLNHLSVSVRMVILSDFMAGPPPKSEAETLSSHVLGVGTWVCAARAYGAKAAMASAGKTYRTLFIRGLLNGLWGLRQNRLETAGWVVNGS